MLVRTNSRFAMVRYASNGTMDATFSTDGKATTTFPPKNGASAYGLPTNRSGKLVGGSSGIVVGGRAGDPFNGSARFAVAKFTSTGTLDNVFSGDGRSTADFPGTMVGSASAVAIDANGKIVLAGSAGAILGSSRFAVARYNADGTLDNTFSGDGRVTTPFPTGPSAWASSVAIDPNGKIVVAGTAQLSDAFPDKRGFAVARYNADGTLDNTFSGDGRVAIEPTTAGARLNALAIDANGKIVVVGGTQVSQFIVIRYNSDGTLDTTFSSDGFAAALFPGFTFAEPQGVAIDANGKIVVAGKAGAGDGRFAVARFNANGTLDTTFSGDGMVTTTFPGATNAQVYAVAIDANGKIVVAGKAGAGDNTTFAVARYNADGTLDGTFSGDGRDTPIFPTTEWSEAYAVAIDASNRIVVAGSAGDLEQVPDPVIN